MASVALALSAASLSLAAAALAIAIAALLRLSRPAQPPTELHELPAPVAPLSIEEYEERIQRAADGMAEGDA